MNIALSDGSLEEMVPFLDGLNKSSSEPFELKIHTANWQHSGKIYFTKSCKRICIALRENKIR